MSRAANRHCCNRMATEALKKCQCPAGQHKERTDCPDVLISRCAKGYLGILVRDGVSEPRTVEINFCPFCGAVANR